MPVKMIPEGTRYGRLTTTGKYELRKGNSCFECICDCGSVVWKRGKEPTVWNIYATSDYTYMYKSFYDIGKTVFLTQSEAEEKLRESEGK